MDMQRWARVAVAAALLLCSTLLSNAATLMPNGKQQFIDGNGVPLAGGFVFMFQPNTAVCKNTWQDAAQTTLNACPIVLDANGEAIIYGTGTYSQEVQDSLGNLIWNQFTTDTSASNSVFWAGTSSGTPNAITVVDANFNGTDGVVLQFVALATNTGPTTLNPSSFGALTIVKDTTAGPVVLSGGEIIAGNVISVVYSSSGNNFHLLNTVIASASASTGPSCGASGLKIVNNSSTPNSIINLTADQIVMETTAGFTIKRSNVSLTAINITQGNVTSTANGMDGEAPGTNAWLDIFAIDNGSAPAGLVSLATGNGKSPSMPSGYTYKCYLGAMRVNAGGNLFRTVQRGNEASYTVITGSTTAALPTMSSGSTGNPTAGPTFTTVSTASYIPPTATKISVITGGTSGAPNIIVSPNDQTGIATSSNAFFATVGAAGTSSQVTMVLESTNIYWASNGASGQLLAYGWKDAVNAN